MLIEALELVHWMAWMHSLHHLNRPDVRMVLVSAANRTCCLSEPWLSWIFVLDPFSSFDTTENVHTSLEQLFIFTQTLHCPTFKCTFVIIITRAFGLPM